MSKSDDVKIIEAIQRIAARGVYNASTGVVYGTERITGYVKKFHDDPADELFGTVDVKEFSTSGLFEEEDDKKIGYHEGVRLSALGQNKDQSGYLIIPKIHSEVTIAKDPASGVEHVVMFSHVDLIQLDSHEKLVVGVTEREPYDEDSEEGDDVSELKKTGISATTLYTKDLVKTKVYAKKNDQEEIALHQIGKADDGVQVLETVGSKTYSKKTADKIEEVHDKASVTLDASKAMLAMNKTSVTVEDGTVYVGDKVVTDDAVLGQELANILLELIGYITQIMTTTSLGPQPPVNLAAFAALRAKIQGYAAGKSGFITQKVKIQK